MSFYDEKHVTTCDGIVLWNGITEPETDPQTGVVSHSVKIAIPANAPEKGELEQLANNALIADATFKGQLPAGGNWPVMDIDLTKFPGDEALLQGRVAINAKTRNGAPSVFDQNGQELAAMQYGRMLYPGAVVKVLVHCYSFNNKSKGVAFGLDGVQIVDATAPKLNVGGGLGSAAVAAAFGAAPGQPAAPAPAQQFTQQEHATQPAGVQPYPEFVTGAAGTPPAPPPAAPVRQMTPAAQGATYEQMIAAGWTDELLIQHGMMMP